MKTRAELYTELTTSQELLNIIVTKRKKKTLVRWILGAIFYISFWQFSWVRFLFWIGLILELILLTFTLLSYFRLRSKIQTIQQELKLD